MSDIFPPSSTNPNIVVTNTPLPVSGTVAVSSISGTVATSSATPIAANVLDGVFTASSATSATLITVPAGRTWIGQLTINVTCSVTAAASTAGSATGTISTTGIGVTPAAGIILQCDTKVGANSATGTVGNGSSNAIGPLRAVIIAPAGNSVTLSAASSNMSGAVAIVNASAIGELQ